MTDEGKVKTVIQTLPIATKNPTWSTEIEPGLRTEKLVS
jgi:hypothetical protein